MVKAVGLVLSSAGVLAACFPTVQASWDVLAANVTYPTHETVRRLEQSCVLEQSTDFVGNNIANVPGASAGDCCSKCATTPGCGAFSWTNYNGGTCYLKSAKGATKSAGGVTSAVVISVPSGSCVAEQGVDYVGNDIANSPGQASDCCAQCSVLSGCGAFTWSNHNGGTCWLKSSKGATTASAGAVSGVRNPATCSQEINVDYTGNDLSNSRGDAGSCCGKCASVSGCKAYTWSDYQGGTCWLKTGKGATKSAAGVVSGEAGDATPTPTTPTPTDPTTPTPTDPATPTPTTPAPTTPMPTTLAPMNPQCQIQKNVDFVGNDVGSVPGADSLACCSKCLDNPGCNAFTWSSFNGGTCYLKSGQGATKESAGVDSAVVTRPPPQNSCSINANTDYQGLDITNVQRSKPEACCDACASYSGCGAFTWTDFNGGTCWLKSAAGQSSYKAGSFSAVVTVVNPPKNHIQYQMRSGAVPLKSVNLGGWLVTEYWMSYTSPQWKNAWNYANQGEYAVMRGQGHDADSRFEEHRRTWITEDDIRQIAEAGLNSVRVPVGYWIVADDPTTWKNDAMRMFAPGSLKYLDKLVNEWAVKYNVAVMLSLHAHLGSQNGLDHSAPFALGQISWGYGETVENSLQMATFLAARYKLSPAFLGMNLMNEPGAGINLDTMKNYYMEAYRRIRTTGNDCILVTSPLLQNQGPDPAMQNFMRWPQYNNVWHEFHIYYKWGYDGHNEWQLIGDAGSYRRTHLDPWEGNYILMGEWSLASPDSARFYDLNTLREFARVQMEQFKGAHSGWAFWSWKHGDEAKIESRGWSLREMLRLGVISLK